MTIPKEELERLARGLSQLERELIEGKSKQWGSWMWDVSGDLIRKGLMGQRVPGERFMTELGLALRYHILEQETGHA